MKYIFATLAFFSSVLAHATSNLCEAKVDSQNVSVIRDASIGDIASILLLDNVKEFTVCADYGQQVRIVYILNGKVYVHKISGQ